MFVLFTFTLSSDCELHDLLIHEFDDLHEYRYSTVRKVANDISDLKYLSTNGYYFQSDLKGYNYFIIVEVDRYEEFIRKVSNIGSTSIQRVLPIFKNLFIKYTRGKKLDNILR
jgi:hypothetical protein